MSNWLKIFLISMMLLFNNDLTAKSFSVMTFNVENMFDNLDDPNKKDETYLPVSMKTSQIHISECNKLRYQSWRDDCLKMDWNDEVISYKLKATAEVILSYDSHGPDIIGFQEIENLNILERLFKILEPHGYKYFALVEGNDNRGIDNAFISKFEIVSSKLHKIKFKGGTKDQIGDTRPILEGVFSIDDHNVSIFNVHFPAPYNPRFMREDAFNTLNELSNERTNVNIALGDFNVTSLEDADANLYGKFNKDWYISHLDQCKECKGTNYYYRDDRWSFLDAVMLKKKRNSKFIEDSVVVIRANIHTRENGSPLRFNARDLKGVSDHFPVVAVVEIN
tara:strand:- start:1562 stop:2569 length:1008 start_codon:yes stop_codon:yes gene_type:complete